MKRLFANCLVLFLLCLAFSLQAQNPCNSNSACIPINPVQTDAYCASDFKNCESACANLNILFLTTPAARDDFADTENYANPNNIPLNIVIRDAVAEFRTALTNSNINHKTVTYSIYDDDDSIFKRTGDRQCDVRTLAIPGFNTEMEDLRVDYNADIVVLITDQTTDYVGASVAQIGPNRISAYCLITSTQWLIDPLVLTHELGHIFGARHDRDVLTDPCVDPTYAIGACQHGWKFIDSNQEQVRTLMSYPGPNGTFSTRIPYFSSPTNLTADGDIPGNTDPSKPITDNAGFIGRTFCDVANFETVDRIVLQHGAGDSRDAFVQYVAPFGYFTSPVNGTNYGSSESINLSSGMLPGAFGFNFFSKKRVYLDFDWDRIPAGSEIIEARLSLSYNPDDQTEITNGHTGDNQFSIKRVISSWPFTNWDEQGITWNNQPQATNSNQVIASASTSSTQDYLSIDVTDMVKDMFDPCAFVPKHGFQLKLVNEQVTKSLIFASSEHPNPKLRPKLEITFNSCNPFPLTNCLTLAKQAAPTTDFVKVYPNPTTDKINLKFTEAQDSKIELFDLQGKMVQNQQSIGQYDAKISLGHLTKGVYIIKVTTKDGLQHSQKIHLQ